MDNIIKVNGMWVPADDQHINEWISGQPFTQNKCLTHFIRYCEQNDISFRTAIDVGAWCGTWAKIMSEHCHKIVAFEPDPTHYECLTKNVGMDVETHQLAVGSESRLISLNTDRHTQSKRVVGTGDIPMITLDSLEIEDVDLIKIDVEGLEMQVLEGARNTLEKAQYIMIELNNNSKKYGSSNTQIEQYLDSMGWRMLLNHWPDKVFTKK